MKKIVLAMAFTAFILTMAVSYGEEWLYYIESPRGDSYYVDVDSIKHMPDNTIRVTEKTVFRDMASPLSMRISDVELDCGKKKMRVLQIVNTHQGGKTETQQRDEGWQDVNPEDMKESLFEIVCSLKKKGQ